MQDPNDRRVEIALKHCASEPVETPGAIQPNGALIAVDASSREISFASENVSAYLNVGHGSLLGQPLQKVLGGVLEKAIVLDPGSHPTRPLGVLPFGTERLMVSGCVVNPFCVFEFERLVVEKDLDPETQDELEAVLRGVETAPQSREVFQKLVHLLFLWSGYDRVLLYQFIEGGHGEVLAEAHVPNAEPLLGLRFPAWDIPQQARTLMTKVPFRYISDVTGPKVPVRAARLSLDPLNLSFAHLRGTSLLHRMYLKNMGASASFTLNLTVQGKLWGMISFHHFSPRTPSPGLRQTCQKLAQKLQAALARREKSLASMPLPIRANSARPECISVAPQFSESDLEKLCAELDADGAAFLKSGMLTTYGLVPSRAASLNAMRPSNWTEEIVSTSALRTDYPSLAQEFGDTIRGFLIANLSDDRCVAFFRRQQSFTQRWAGPPEKHITRAEGTYHLKPRASFRPIEQTVLGHSKPWTWEQLCRVRGLCS